MGFCFSDFNVSALTQVTRYDLPTATNTFETFFVPLTTFTNVVYVLHDNGVNDVLTEIDFSMKRGPSQPDTTWPSEADNLLMLDKISYIVEPQLNIANQSETSVVVSWPTNTTGFVLQKTTQLDDASWRTMPDAVVVTNSLNAVVLPKESGQAFYRLWLQSP